MAPLPPRPSAGFPCEFPLEIPDLVVGLRSDTSGGMGSRTADFALLLGVRTRNDHASDAGGRRGVVDSRGSRYAESPLRSRALRRQQREHYSYAQPTHGVRRCRRHLAFSMPVAARERHWFGKSRAAMTKGAATRTRRRSRPAGIQTHGRTRQRRGYFAKRTTQCWKSISNRSKRLRNELPIRPAEADCVECRNGIEHQPRPFSELGN